MAKKKVVALVKIQIQAGAASPAPPVGTALGPHGVAIMDFCKEYNARTEAQRGTVVPVEISIFEDRTFSFVTKTPPAPVLIREAVGIAKGSQTPGRGSVATISDAQLTDIAQIKLPDLNTDDIEAAKLQIAGTARSMGILVEGGLSFLGFGVQPPRSSLGALIQQGSTYLLAAPWLVVTPGIVLVVAILAINVFGDGLRDGLEPRKARSLT